LEIKVLEISPIENAIMITEQKTRELESLHRRYLALTKTSDAKLNTNPLSMALNAIVDTPVKTGIPAFRNGWFHVPSVLSLWTMDMLMVFFLWCASRLARIE
jgi:dedicator of cytokinesis protein 3